MGAFAPIADAADAADAVDVAYAGRARSIDRGPGVYRIVAQNAYLRTHAGNGLAKGQLFRGDRFNVHEVRSGYAWGHAPRIKQWGWMRLASGKVDGSGRGIPGTGKANMVEVAPSLPRGTRRRRARQLNGGIVYVRPSDVRRYGLRGYTFDASPKKGARLYANVVDGKGRDQIRTDFDRYGRVGVRWARNRDWYVVLARDADGSPRWANMRRSSLIERPDRAYRAWLRDHPNFVR